MRERVSELFERWAGVVTRHPWAVLVVALAVGLVSALQIPNIVGAAHETAV